MINATMRINKQIENHYLCKRHENCSQHPVYYMKFSVGLFSVLVLGSVTTPAWCACVKPPASAEAIGHFRSNPQAFLPDSSSDPHGVEVAARVLAGTDAALAEGLVKIAKTAQPALQTAIAAGLAQAALACATVDQNAAQQIQQAVANFDNVEFQALFAAIAGDLTTAATSAAVGSAGSVVITNPNRSKATAGNPSVGGTPSTTVVNVTGSTVFSNVAGSTVFSVAAPSLTTAGAASAATPVSPTR
jgi:hypothetical protein